MNHSPPASQLFTHDQIATALRTLLQGARHVWGFFLIIIMIIFNNVILNLVRAFQWCFSTIYQIVIGKPLGLAIYLLKAFFPLIVYCFAAATCGMIIGACLGYASEAISSALIEATWGRTTITKIPETDAKSDTCEWSPIDDNVSVESHAVPSVETLSSTSSRPISPSVAWPEEKHELKQSIVNTQWTSSSTPKRQTPSSSTLHQRRVRQKTNETNEAGLVDSLGRRRSH